MFKYLVNLIGTLLGTLIPGLRPGAGGGPARGRQLALLAISVVVLVFCVVRLYRAFNPEFLPPETSYLPYDGIGAAMAEQTNELLDGRGRVAVWIWDDGGESPWAYNERMLAAYRSALENHRQLEIVAEERVAMDDDDPSLFKTGDFRRLLKQYRDVDAIVSFLGMPELSRADIKALARPRPKILSWNHQYHPPELLETLFYDDLVQVVAGYRVFSAANQHQQTPATPREWFDAYGQVDTPATAGRPGR